MTKLQKVKEMTTLWDVVEDGKVIGLVTKLGPNFYSVEPVSSGDHPVTTVSYRRDAVAALRQMKSASE